MDVILKEIEVEKRNRKKELPSNASERAINYGVVDKVIKKHKEANPWLTRDSLNNYQRLKGEKALNSDGESIPKTISAGKNPQGDSVSALSSPSEDDRTTSTTTHSSLTAQEIESTHMKAMTPTN
jgi:hypothetical protein